MESERGSTVRSPGTGGGLRGSTVRSLGTGEFTREDCEEARYGESRREYCEEFWYRGVHKGVP